jgi:Tol biopolymer transport system component
MLKKISNIIWLSLFFILTLSLCFCHKPKSDANIDTPHQFSAIDYAPAWSPDGEWIAYIHIGSTLDSCGIYLIKADGTENKQWHKGNVESPTWKPDSKWIAFSESGQILMKNIKGDSTFQITNKNKYFSPKWSPSGDLIMYTHNVCDEVPCGIWFCNINDLSSNFIVKYGSSPDFNPANTDIIYKKRWIQENGTVLGDSIFTYDYDSSSNNFIVRLQDSTWDNRYFKFNKTGTKVLFVSQSSIGSPIPALWIMNSDGTNLERLSSKGYIADWNPDGTKIVFTETFSTGRLWIMDINGNNLQQLTFKHSFNN